MFWPAVMLSLRYADTSAASIAERTMSLGRLRSAASCVTATRKSLFMCSPTQSDSSRIPFNKESGDRPTFFKPRIKDVRRQYTICDLAKTTQDLVRRRSVRTRPWAGLPCASGAI